MKSSRFLKYLTLDIDIQFMNIILYAQIVVYFGVHLMLILLYTKIDNIAICNVPKVCVKTLYILMYNLALTNSLF